MRSIWHPWGAIISSILGCCQILLCPVAWAQSPQKSSALAKAVSQDHVNTTGAIRLLGAIAPGTRTSQSPGVALLKHSATGQVAAIAVGKKVFDIGTLSFVSSKMAIVIDNSGVAYTVYSKLGAARVAGAPATVTPAPIINEAGRYAEEGFERIGTQVQVDSAYRDRMVTQELPTILMSAASEPVVEGGTIRGFRLFQFEPGSIFEKLGMQDGDIVESINGVPLNDVARTIQFLNGLKSENNVEVTISRGGRTVTLDLSVK